jgi:hypothetical protein
MMAKQKKPTKKAAPASHTPSLKKIEDGKIVVATTQDKISDVSGLKNPDFQTTLLGQIIESMWLPANANNDRFDQQATAAIVALKGINPRDEIEGMLAAQMVAIHNASMECLTRAMIVDQGFESRNANLNQATKLTRTFTTQMEALNRHRGKGQQKMTVEHVHVHDGGQAIVGSVTQGGGVDTKKERQPHAK